MSSIVQQSSFLDAIQRAKLANEFVELGGVKPNPVDTKVYEGIELARKENVDFMLPVGGGSVIDTAKSIAVGVCYDGDFWDFYEGKAEIKAALKVGVVLTIPAAGSEGSGNAVITNKDLKKFGIRAPKLLRPVFAIMNPELTMTLPAWQTASGVVDMMVHIFERYFTNTKNVSISDRLCEGILLSIIEEAPKVMANPNDYDARANIMWAGTVAHNGTCGVGREEEWTSHQMEHETAIQNASVDAIRAANIRSQILNVGPTPNVEMVVCPQCKNTVPKEKFCRLCHCELAIKG